MHDKGAALAVVVAPAPAPQGGRGGGMPMPQFRGALLEHPGEKRGLMPVVVHYENFAKSLISFVVRC